MKALTMRKLLPLTVLTAAAVLTACERPPMDVEQLGYRGVGMEQVTNPRLAGATRDANVAPDPLPPVTPGGPRAGDLYENVEVLGDLTIVEFNRLMTALTEWVSPDEGCNYCHVPGNFASEDIYTKVVSRRMLEMTKTINDQWQAHVGDTGVTCYTCHQGKPVPEYVWFEERGGPAQAGGMAASRRGQNLASPVVGSTSLPSDAFTAFLLGDQEIRIIPTTALPAGTNPANIMDAEWTYGLMMHFSTSLGVNCTYCHNSRSFFSWDGSPPQRTTAWEGIQMARELNQEYLVPLQGVYPDTQLGPHGDAPKLNCQTCHQGVNLPLYGVSMLQDYPELGAVSRNGAPRRTAAADADMAPAEAAPAMDPVADEGEVEEVQQGEGAEQI